MQAVRTIIAASFAVFLGTHGATGQSLRGADEPAEFPPASFKGAQYVDSRGCVYVRAGFDGAVSWVPRVTRNRKVLCGYEPSLKSAAAAKLPVIPDPAPTATAPAATTKTATARATAKTTTKTTTAAPAPAKPATSSLKPPAKPVVVAAPKPAAVVPADPVIKPATKVAAAPAPKPAAPATTPAPSPRQAACQDASSLSRQYINDGAGKPVRCGPQEAHPSEYVTKTVPAGVTLQTANGPVTTTKPTRVKVPVGSALAMEAPAPVLPAAPPAPAPAPLRMTVSAPAPAPAPKAVPIAVPKGYKSAFKDGRLNPNRGPQTATGDAQMARVWDDSLPRRAAPAPAVTTQARVTTSSKGRASDAASHRFLQVASFADPAHVAPTVKSLKRLGLPVATSRLSSKGTTRQIVLVGPFTSQAKLDAAMAKTRGAGFPEAILRK